MPIAHPSLAPHESCKPRAALRLVRCCSLVMAAAWLLVACVQSPQAAAVAATGVHQPATTAGNLQDAPPCQTTPTARSTLQRVAHELQAQGLALKAACEPTHEGWVVQVQVVDGTKAREVVRGPLADGQGVDMGTPPGLAEVGASAEQDSGFSPDVQHNRQWLRTLMARHQFNNLPDAWWHFSHRQWSAAQR
ncbi:M15 family metallopeptidase [Acidovorax sp.]|uniref:M15 family metallopeptidase n=1 Tax=Acidovorax sp. TaxID=1872122 RepID=UPI00260CDA30|nr:M15 family metallopeptidase [Acidovorax sp.]